MENKDLTSVLDKWGAEATQVKEDSIKCAGTYEGDFTAREQLYAQRILRLIEIIRKKDQALIQLADMTGDSDVERLIEETLEIGSELE